MEHAEDQLEKLLKIATEKVGEMENLVKTLPDITKTHEAFRIVERVPIVIGETATYATLRGDNSVVVEFPNAEVAKEYYNSLK